MGMELKTNISLCLLMPESIWSVKIQFTILAILFDIDHDPTRYTFIPEAYISRHAGTGVKINRDLYRSLQIFSVSHGPI